MIFNRLLGLLIVLIAVVSQLVHAQFFANYEWQWLEVMAALCGGAISAVISVFIFTKIEELPAMAKGCLLAGMSVIYSLIFSALGLVLFNLFVDEYAYGVVGFLFVWLMMVVTNAYHLGWLLLVTSFGLLPWVVYGQSRRVVAKNSD